MKFTRVRAVVASILIGSHLGSVFLVLLMLLLGGFQFEEFTTALALVVPVFAGFTTAIVKDVISTVDSEPDSGRVVSGMYATIVISFCSAFSLYLVSVILMKGFNLAFKSFEQFKIMLSIGETAFAVYIGLLLPVLFKTPYAGQRSRAQKRK